MVTYLRVRSFFFSLAYVYMLSDVKPKVAVTREEGSNGDREMSAALYAAGFEPWDVSDLLAGAITFHQFRGVVFVGALEGLVTLMYLTHPKDGLLQ